MGDRNIEHRINIWGSHRNVQKGGEAYIGGKKEAIGIEAIGVEGPRRPLRGEAIGVEAIGVVEGPRRPFREGAPDQ